MWIVIIKALKNYWILTYTKQNFDWYFYLYSNQHKTCSLIKMVLNEFYQSNGRLK